MNKVQLSQVARQSTLLGCTSIILADSLRIKVQMSGLTLPSWSHPTLLILFVLQKYILVDLLWTFNWTKREVF